MSHTLELVNVSGINPFDDHLQPRPIQGLFMRSIFAVVELSLLQSLTPDAVATAIKVEDLHLGLLAIPLCQHRWPLT